MLSMARRSLALLTISTLLAGATSGVCAQSSPLPASAVIYSCVDDQGRRITADRPIASCNAREQRVLNKDGSLRAIHPPSLTADERAEKEATERKQAEARAAQSEAVRRDRNLLARYPNEAAHRKAREASLDTARTAMKNSEARLGELVAERKPLLAEAEFYAGKTLPAKLRGQLDANDAATTAQREVMITQEAELDRVNQLYDAELARLKQLWAGAAPGSPALVASQRMPTPVAASPSGPKGSALR